MFGLINRFFNESLENPLSVASKETLILEKEGVLLLTSRQSFIRSRFAALFALPCLYYLYYTLTHPSVTTVLIALIICPFMTLTSLLFWRVESSKLIDGKRRSVTSKIRFFSYMKEVAEPLAAHDTITLNWHWEAGGSESTGYNVYTITGTTGNGLRFSTLNNYSEARAFAERLSVFLGFTLENCVPAERRVDI